MDRIGEEIVYPTFEQVCSVNRRLIGEYGGDFEPPTNLRNPGALSYILDAVVNSIYGRDSYPTLKEKAAALAYHIITRHIFHNGNKRTASHLAWEFLRANGVSLVLDESIIELTDAIAAGTAQYNELLQWLHGHQ